MFETKWLSVGIVGTAALCVASAGSATGTQEESLATLSNIKGSVLVDNGNNFATATEGMSVGAGSRIFVLEDGKVTVALSDGCQAEVSGPASQAFEAGITCEDLSAMQQGSLEKVAAGAAESSQARLLQQAATSQLDERALGLGILGLAAVGGVTWAATNDSGNNNPSAPPAQSTSTTTSLTPISPQ